MESTKKLARKITRTARRSIKSRSPQSYGASRLSEQEIFEKLTGEVFIFGKLGQEPFTHNFRMAKDQTIQGYQDDNEHSWKLSGNKLQIFNILGEQTSEFLIGNDLTHFIGESFKFPGLKFELKKVDFNKKLYEQLKGTKYSFGKKDESPFTNDFELDEDFTIGIYNNDNEKYWNVIGDKLQIFDISGKLTSQFEVGENDYHLSGESLRFSGVQFEMFKNAKVKRAFTKGGVSEYIKDLKDEYRLQNIVFPKTSEEKGQRRDLFYHGAEVVSFGNLNLIDGYTDFSSYINSLSLRKWLKYTKVKDFYLKLWIKGKFKLEITQNFLVFNDKIIQEKSIENVFEDLHKSDTDDIFARNVMNYQSGNSRIVNDIVQYNFDFTELTEIILPVSVTRKDDLVGFAISGKAEIQDAGWFTTIESQNINPVNLVINTTTFQKEKYILRNLQNIQEQIMGYAEKGLGLNQLGEGHLFVNVVDNGRTLDKSVLDNEFVRIYSNPNVGGAGGFSRGMIETLNLQEKGICNPTHVIFMDDDIEVLPESFKRVFSLLSLVKKEYEDYFIEGGMMDSDSGVKQHEDTGFISKNKEIAYLAVKDTYDLTRLHDVLRNDIEYPVDNEYGAWWYCTVPMKYINENSMSLPIFYRGDDIEFSTRNNAKFITLNGIAVWHMPFYAKKSKSLENYLVPRNSFIDQAVNGFWKDAGILDKYLELYKKEIRMFNYNAADQVLDALDDYLKGPEYIASLKGIEPLLKEKKKDEKFSTKIPEEIQKNLHTVDDNWALWPGDYDLFIKTDNGHGLPEIALNSNDDELENVAIINQNLADAPGKQFMKKRLVIYDTYNKAYTILERNQEKYEELEKRYAELLAKYQEIGEQVAADYRNHAEVFHSKEFWENYLKEQMEG